LLAISELQNSVRFIRERGYGIVSSVSSRAELSAALSESSSTVKRSRAGARHVLSLASVSAIARRGEAGESGAITCTVAVGDVVAMRPLVLHASCKSESDEPRRVLHIEYARSRGIGDGLELALV